MTTVLCFNGFSFYFLTKSEKLLKPLTNFLLLALLSGTKTVFDLTTEDIICFPGDFIAFGVDELYSLLIIGWRGRTSFLDIYGYSSAKLTNDCIFGFF
jgi:hypothetical protein